MYEVTTGQTIDQINAQEFREEDGWLIFYEKRELTNIVMASEVARFKSDLVLSVKLLAQVETYATQAI